MKNVKKWASTLLALCLVLVSLAACGGNGNSGGSASPSGQPVDSGAGQASDQQVNLRFSWWGTDTRHQATLAAIDAYTKLHPNVKIEAEYMGFDGYFKKLLTQFAGGTAPDIMQYSYEWHNDMAGFLLDLKSSSALDVSTFDASVINDFGTYQDRTIMVPAGVFAASALYNASFFEKYQIPVDTVWTWDQLMEIGKQVHEQDPNAYLLTADIDVIDKMIVKPYVAQLSGNNWIHDDYTTGFTREQLVQGLTFLSDLYKNGVIEPFGDSSAFVGKMDQNPKWINGQIGMVLDYVQFFDKYQQSVQGGKLGVAAFPLADNAATSGNPIIPGVGFVVNKETKQAEEAAKFLNWLVNDKEAAVLLGTQRGIPASTTARQALQDANQLKPEISKGLELAGQHPALSPNIISTNTEVGQIAKDEYEKLIYQKETPEEAADIILKSYETKLKELKAN